MATPEITDKMKVEKNVISALKEIFDPEIPVNVFDLGLIYEVDVQEDMHVNIVMTLTAPNCPVAESLPNEIKEKVAATEGVKDASIELTFEPPWDKDLMSDEAKLDLGFL
ncbi:MULTISPECIES: SUF system Fe-S cluster assembly protein [unclassified Lentimicrobium]|uniref:SUF system Fe-S cluster assembly protein n=1 Tax=unclassified Lentimicrobium TaxID=2677434 RepID=UPI001C12F379|nr:MULTISPECIES: SUF system Fe-S cluster assembly protein [unclassified Lentimicrobium]